MVVKKMIKVTDEALTENYTQVFHETEDCIEYGAPNNFMVKDLNGKILTYVRCQTGPIKEVGVNGVANEDLLAMVLARLKYFQSGPFACPENKHAIESIRTVLSALRFRTINREAREVEGTSKI